MYKPKKVCYQCHIAFDASLDRCPKCHKEVIIDNNDYADVREGKGRAYGVGGMACDLCPHCYGSSDWCPFMD